ncbi:MAG: L,D-transpeptidase [Gaiellaceae bacterium]
MRALLLALVAALVAAGCGSAEPEDELAVQSRGGGTPPSSLQGGGEPVAEAGAAKECEAGRRVRVGDRRVAYAAWARGRLVALRQPGGAPVQAFGRTNVNGVRTVFGVLGAVRDDRCRPLWYRVQLPIRPNGATGYVRAGDVRLFRVRTRIEVDLSERRVDFFRSGRHVLRVTAAIGAEGTPTPTGRYYVNQRLLSGDASGPYGPGGIGISAFSPVLTGWTQGGPIAIHGTNDPGSIGEAASYGCLRIENRHVERMLRANPEGTPVSIRA